MEKVLDTRVVSIGNQDFEKLVSRNSFYIDKTHFIKEWWESEDDVTLITRPRRFGKTLLMSMVEKFFSLEYKEKSCLFEGLRIFEEDRYRKLQGTYPVIFLSFASMKESRFEDFYERVQNLLADLFRKYKYLLKSNKLGDEDKELLTSFLTRKARRADMVESLCLLSDCLYRFHGKKAIILLDEYDTPMQEAYLSGYWDEMTVFIRGLFNSAFKTNPYLERALLTGITRVSKESIFSDLNNLEVVTTTSEKYEDSFGFTEDEVFHALEERGLGDQKEAVKQWYDGFRFGELAGVYNPWSITNFLDKKKFRLYWANTSSNGLISRLLQTADKSVKEMTETLLQGGTITASFDEQIVFNQLGKKKEAIWSLMLASGYLKAESADLSEEIYTLSLTNREVRQMLKRTIKGWFQDSGYYGEFLTALLSCDVEAMEEYLNRLLLQMASFFLVMDFRRKSIACAPVICAANIYYGCSIDVSRGASAAEPESFYHGLVLGLIAELEGRYFVRSNRESGFGRYDVMLEPVDAGEPAFILEFKVFNSRKEGSLEDTVNAGLKQIEERKYCTELVSKGFSEENIRSYAFAFSGKEVLVKEGNSQADSGELKK